MVICRHTEPQAQARQPELGIESMTSDSEIPLYAAVTPLRHKSRSYLQRLNHYVQPTCTTLACYNEELETTVHRATGLLMRSFKVLVQSTGGLYDTPRTSSKTPVLVGGMVVVVVVAVAAAATATIVVKSNSKSSSNCSSNSSSSSSSNNSNINSCCCCSHSRSHSRCRRSSGSRSRRSRSPPKKLLVLYRSNPNSPLLSHHSSSLIFVHHVSLSLSLSLSLSFSLYIYIYRFLPALSYNPLFFCFLSLPFSELSCSRNAFIFSFLLIHACSPSLFDFLLWW